MIKSLADNYIKSARRRCSLRIDSSTVFFFLCKWEGMKFLKKIGGLSPAPSVTAVERVSYIRGFFLIYEKKKRKEGRKKKKNARLQKSNGHKKVVQRANDSLRSL